MIIKPTQQSSKKGISTNKERLNNSSNIEKYVIKINTKDLFKDNCLDYYVLDKSLFAYVFDKPSRINNKALVVYGKNKMKSMYISELLFHICFWRANILFNIPITEEFFYDLKIKGNSDKMFFNILNSIAKTIIEHENDVTDEVCDCMVHIKERLSEISDSFSVIKCNTLSIYDTIQFANRNEKFKKLLDTKLDKSKTPSELGQQMKDMEKELISVIKEDGKNCYAPYIDSGRIKSAQLTKVLCAVGPRTDIDKTILPWPITTGYLKGIQSAAEYFMDTVTARDAMLTKNDNVPRSGFLSRQINRLTSNIFINYEIEDCNSKNYLEYTVLNLDYLKMIIGKNYLNEESGKLENITESSVHLVGKTIKLRSFIGCASKSKYGVCKTCVGKDVIRLKGTLLGTLPPIKSVNPLSQKAMSAKHDMTANSVEITNEYLKKYFYHDGSDFYISQEYANDRNKYLVVLTDDIEEALFSSIDMEDSSIDTRIDLNYIAVRDGIDEFVIENENTRVVLSDEIISSRNIFIEDPENPDLTLIPFSKIENESPAISLIIDTEEISKYLNSFIGTIDRISIKNFKNYNDLMSEMNRIIYEAGFINKVIHFESIIYYMIRDSKDETIRPDFSIENNTDYQILRVSSAIEKKDMYTTISFQGLRRLFKSPSIYKRIGTSLYDPFFRISELF